MDLEETVNFLPEEWPSNPDDFMDLFQLDTALLFGEANNGSPDGMNDISSSLINNLQNGFSSYGSGPGELGMMAAANLGLPEQAMSPLSSLSSDQEFHGFPGSTAGSLADDGEDEFMGDASPEMAAAVVPTVAPEPAVPATIKMDLLEDDGMAEFNAFERSVAEQQQQLGALSSSASDSGLSSDNLDFATDYEALSPALSSPGPSISERGGQNSPPRYIKQEPIQKQQIIVQQQQPQQQTVTAVMSKAGKVYQTVKTVISNGAQQFKKAAPPAKVIVEKAQPDFEATVAGANITASGGLVLSKDQLQTTQLVNGKEVKIYRVATAKSGQTVANNLNKKVTLQLKNGSTANGKSGGTVFLNNKNVVLTSGGASNGVRKIIRVQQQQQQNGRSILVPVSIQDLRTIKIVNPANLKAKSANIKLAAANLLQQSKQGLIQKNVVLSKDQLVMDDGGSDTAPNSDNESFVFEDIMQQSNSVIEQVQKQQHHHHSLVSDSDAEDLDDDLDGDDGMSLTGGKTASGAYQKLVLTAEEKRLLAKEGISLPTSYPLTKHEERELKRIRRKIRNKISAQDSRKRKKEYVDGLEERVKQCTEENQTLLKRIKILQSQNHDLMSQMKKIQSLLTKGTGKTTQPATCLMVLLLSMALVAVPNLKLGGTQQQQNIQDSIEMAELLQDAATEKTQVQTPQAQSRRSLLFDTKEQLGDALVDEEINFDEIMAFNVNSLIANEHDYTSEEEPPKAKKAKTHSLVDYDVDDDVWNGSSKMRIKQEAEETLFNQKAAQFQRAFEQTMANSEHSSGFNIKSEVIVDRELLESVKHSAELYSTTTTTFAKDGHNIDLMAAAGGKFSSDVEEANQKLNASQQIQQQNNKRKLLL
uniref:Putative bzip transcription factor n=1 Tax=Culex tarsalis TaxID=7177 RepID=A0A1Q3FK87_CULTA